MSPVSRNGIKKMDHKHGSCVQQENKNKGSILRKLCEIWEKVDHSSKGKCEFHNVAMA